MRTLLRRLARVDEDFSRWLNVNAFASAVYWLVVAVMLWLLTSAIVAIVTQEQLFDIWVAIQATTIWLALVALYMMTRGELKDGDRDMRAHDST